VDVDWHLRLRASSDGRFLLVQRSAWLEVLEGETAALLQHLEPDGALVDAHVLRDGILYREGARGRMRIGYLRPFDGAPALTWELGPQAEPVAEIEPGRLLVRLDPNTHEPGGQLAHPRYVVLDLESGGTLEPPPWLGDEDAPYLGPILSPARQSLESLGTASSSPVRPISVRTRYAAPPELLWVNLESGEARPFLR
jgi:hypothetical protein